MEQLERIEYNQANERENENTVQPRAVNLAYAEPCPDEKSRRGSFHFGAVCARSARRWQGRGGSPWPCASQGMETGERRLSHENSFRQYTKRSRPRQVAARLYARTAPHPRAGTRGPRPRFEGAHPIRRCAAFSTSAHLGKARRFLRRCAPFSKMRTKTAHLRKERGAGPRRWSSTCVPKHCGTLERFLS
jgi:hypothetical protein